MDKQRQEGMSGDHGANVCFYVPQSPLTMDSLLIS